MRSRRPSAPVLVVEDNAETREVLELVLHIEGYSVAIATNGAEALEYLRAGKRPCVIILDLRMPVMDGWTFLREVQADAELVELPVIAFSANVERDVPGTVATIRKASLNPDAFLGVIERACLKDFAAAD